jgi:hypothetical protein
LDNDAYSQQSIVARQTLYAELLGFYQDGEMKKVGEETYFVSSTSTSTSAGAGAGASAKDKDTTHFILDLNVANGIF